MIGFILLNTPAWMFSSILNTATQGKLYVTNVEGNFWSGDGLLMIKSNKKVGDTPLLHVNWTLSLGFSNLINLSLYNDSNGKVLSVDVTRKLAINITEVNLSLSIIQLTKLYDKVSEFGLSGQLEITANNLMLGAVNSGTIGVNVTNLVSTMSPVNPVGSYHIDYNLKDNNISINTTDSSAAIALSANSNVNNLSIKATPAADKKDKLLQLMTIIAIPNPDGSYTMKLG